MKRTLAIAVCMLIALVGATIAGTLWSRPAAPRRAPATLRSAAPPRVVGVAGCSGGACHGGTIADDDRKSPFAASLWLALDPHAVSFKALDGDRAHAIMKNLGHACRLAKNDVRCLACHSVPASTFAAETAELDRSIRAVSLRNDGVGCESCHGPAGNWLDEHASWNRDPASRRARYRDRGMSWLNDSAGRARACVGCHVGAPAENGLPRREVTHELIAAGHPRLMFELASYWNALPKHWKPRDRTKPQPLPDDPAPDAADDWLAGQLETASAVMRLAEPACGAVWPELSQLDCCACHHDLTANQPSSRPRMRANSWNLSPLVLRIGGPKLIAAADALPSFEQPDPKMLRAACKRIEELQASLAGRSDRRSDRPGLLADTMIVVSERPSLRWDEAAQLALAFSAWSDSATAAPLVRRKLRDQLIAELRFEKLAGVTQPRPKNHVLTTTAGSLSRIAPMLKNPSAMPDAP